MKTDAEKISHHENELSRMVDRAIRRLEARGFFRDEPPKRKWRGVALRERKP